MEHPRGSGSVRWVLPTWSWLGKALGAGGRELCLCCAARGEGAGAVGAPVPGAPTKSWGSGCGSGEVSLPGWGRGQRWGGSGSCSSDVLGELALAWPWFVHLLWSVSSWCMKSLSGCALSEQECVTFVFTSSVHFWHCSGVRGGYGRISRDWCQTSALSFRNSFLFIFFLDFSLFSPAACLPPGKSSRGWFVCFN